MFKPETLETNPRTPIKANTYPEDKPVSLQEHKNKFANLEFIDILLTNACNLSCSYCYEQHNTNFGRWNTQLIRKAWDWLKGINATPHKYIQFFGGEPLIHKQLILDFMKENKDEIVANKDIQNISITTNGLLLTDDFINEYFSYPNVKMMISLDTLDSEKDHRYVKPQQLAKLLDDIEKITKLVDNPKNFAIRSTLSRDVTPQLKQFWDELYKRGVRQLIFHPLILSKEEGYIEWTEKEWTWLLNDIKHIITNSPDDVTFHVAEGVGQKHKTNCLIGGDEIAVDPSGDFSGCYFFTNRKGLGTDKFLLGNIFDDELYINRYEYAVSEYSQMYKDNPVCQECNVQDLCYQCPAGNASTGNKLFRPDGMCKRFIQLQVDIQHLIETKNSTRMLINTIANYKKDGIPYAIKTLNQIFSQYYEETFDFDKSYYILLGLYYDAIKYDIHPTKVTPPDFGTAKALCDLLKEKHNLATIPNVGDFYKDDPDVPYIAVLKMLIEQNGIRRES
jgi:radical SAM protein with 4Fe4S-binding SPASM domain